MIASTAFTIDGYDIIENKGLVRGIGETSHPGYGQPTSITMRKRLADRVA